MANQGFLFAGGIILGILLSISLLQSDLSAWFPVQNQSTTVSIARDAPQPSDATLKASAHDAASWIKPVTVAQNEVKVAPKLSEQDSSKTTIPRWTPGKESNLSKFKKEAEAASTLMESLTTSHKVSTSDTPNRSGSVDAVSQEETSSDYDEKSNTKAMNRLIKRLKRRQMELEAKGQNTDVIVQKLAALIATRSESRTKGNADSKLNQALKRESHLDDTAASTTAITNTATSSATGATPSEDALKALDAAFGGEPLSEENRLVAAKISEFKQNLALQTASAATTTTTRTSAASEPSSSTVSASADNGTGSDADDRAILQTLRSLAQTSPVAYSQIVDAFYDSHHPALYVSGPTTTQRAVPLPYHQQAQRLFAQYSPWIPTPATVGQQGLELPPNLNNQRSLAEKSDVNLKLHLCNGVFEAYAAAYLTTRAHVLATPSEGYNLSWVNCEMASFIHLKESNRFYQKFDSAGVILQSLDVLDFSVIHLSAFERSSKKHKDAIWRTQRERKTEWHKIEEVKRAGRILRYLNDPRYHGPAPSAAATGPDTLPRLTTRKLQYSHEANRTVVLMPFLGGAMGAGHSELGNRFEYLRTCFWSLYEFFPHIVVSVTRQEDVVWCWEQSELPFFDVLLIEGLPKSAGLPVGTMQEAKRRLLLDEDWKTAFDYVFFSESDQILISRELPAMYQHLQRYPRHMMLPHRLMPYSQSAIVQGLQRADLLLPQFAAHNSVQESAWMNLSCCLPRQNCVERKTWVPLMAKPSATAASRDTTPKAPSYVPIVNYYGLYVPLGNVNFLAESYRACTLTPYVGNYCP